MSKQTILLSTQVDRWPTLARAMADRAGLDPREASDYLWKMLCAEDDLVLYSLDGGLPIPVSGCNYNTEIADASFLQTPEDERFLSQWAFAPEDADRLHDQFVKTAAVRRRGTGASSRGEESLAANPLSEGLDQMRRALAEVETERDNLRAKLVNADQSIDRLGKEKASLADEREKLRIELKALGRRQETTLKVVGGLLKKGHGLDIHATPLKGIGAIVDDLKEVGAGVDETTLRKLIQEAAGIVPRPQ